MREAINLYAAIFLLLLTGFPAFARGNPNTPIVIDESFAQIKVGPYARFFEDTSAAAAIDDIMRGIHEKRFIPSREENPGYGYTASAVWMKFTVKNTTPGDITCYLEIDNPLMDIARLYVLANGSYLEKSYGDHIPFNNREINYRNPVFSLTVKPGDNRYLLRFATTSNMNLPVKLWNPEAFNSTVIREIPLLWMYYGFLLAIILYNLFIFTAVRDRSYLYYVLFIAGYFIFRLAYNGLAFQHLWPKGIFWANRSVPFFVAFLSLWAVQFTRSFLNTKKLSPRFDRVFLSFIIIFAAGMILSFLAPYRIAIQVILLFAFIVVALMIAAGFISLKKGTRESKFYLLAWSAFLIGSFLNILRDFGVLETTMVTQWSQQAGTAIQALLLSLGLADRINTMRKEIAQANIDLVRTHQVLGKEKERLSVTLRSIADAVVTTDLDNRVLYVNTAFERLCGVSLADAIGKPVGSVLTLASGADPIFGDGAEPSLFLTHHAVLRLSNGRELDIEISRVPLRDRDSVAIGYVIVFRDISGRKKMEEEIQKSSKIEILGIIAGGIAHDFNNFLSALLSNISLARLSLPVDSEVQPILCDMEDASYRARSLTQQLIVFSKGGSPVMGEVSVERIIRNTAQFTLSGSRVKVEYDIPPDLWSARADEGQLGQVFNNLIINAMQAMPDGGTLRIAAHNVSIDDLTHVPLQPGNYLQVSVRDEGPGIPEDIKQRVFDPFFTTKGGGSGLGLSSAYMIIKNHGGFIDVENAPGKGTIFTILIPATGTSADVMPVAAPAGAVIPGSGKILLMDDEEMILKAAGRLINKIGYLVDTALNGETAIALYRESMARSEPYDAVILDLTVPGGMGGLDVLKSLREIDAGVRAIVSSGYSNDPVMSDYKSYGFVDYVIKPYTVQTLSEILSRVTGKKTV
ncbi:MAG: response regulator [Spirochaetes bacterium]|nr:response regulator [Spirochaetota bacterium]